MSEDEALKKRFIELGNRSYNQNIYTFTHFLNLKEQDIFQKSRKEMPGIRFELYGGMEFCERVMIRFGSEEMCGYVADFPIETIMIKPLNEKFADNLEHRDFLGAIMNLGIDRSTIGDIFVNSKHACLFCEDKVADYIIEELIKVRHTNVRCEKIQDIPADFIPVYEEHKFSAASERADGIVAAVFKLSRSKSSECFKAGKVFVNGGTVYNSDTRLKEGDVVSLRGFGRFVYKGIENTTRKGRLQIKAEIPTKA